MAVKLYNKLHFIPINPLIICKKNIHYQRTYICISHIECNVFFFFNAYFLVPHCSCVEDYETINWCLVNVVILLREMRNLWIKIGNKFNYIFYNNYFNSKSIKGEIEDKLKNFQQINFNFSSFYWNCWIQNVFTDAAS